MKFNFYKTQCFECYLFALALSVLLAACSSDHRSVQNDTTNSNPTEIAHLTTSNLTVVNGKATRSSTPSEMLLSASPSTDVVDSKHLVTEGVFEGTGSFVQERARSHVISTSNKSGDTSINFVNTDIHEVCKAILGDMLGLNYSISPSVSGNVTIKINQPLPKEAILPTLNTIFHLNGAAIVESGGIVKVVPAGEAPHQGAPLTSVNRAHSSQGFGVQVVPLHYISVDEMQRILSPIAPTGGVVPIDTARNVLILAGTEEERAGMMDVVDAFDVDWLSGMSFGLFPLKEATAKTLANELWEVVGGVSGPLSKTVRIVAFDKLNAVLVVSTQPKYLEQIRAWIDRLDVSQTPSDQKIWVYSVQNGRAADLADTLDRLIHGQSSKSNSSSSHDSSTTANASPSSAILPDLNHMPLPTPMSGDQNSDDNSPHGPKIIADDTTNSLIIMGSKSEFSVIEAALKKLDIIPMQVRIEAVIAEVTLTDDLRYGVQYLLNEHNGGALLTNAATRSISSTLPGFSAFVTGQRISSILDLLESVTTVHVLSSPQLMVLNNQSAMLQVGDQVPVATQSAVSTLTTGSPVVNTIQMTPTGVILKVTPRVNASGMVVMDISQEVSSVTNTTTSNIDSPTIVERKITSSVAVRDSETIALGGLITDNVNEEKTGIPILQDIPYLGSLFGDTTKSRTRTELLALITPHVVRNDKDVRDVTEDMRQQMRAVEPLVAKPH